MDPVDSLDWIWEDFDTADPADEFEDDHDDDDDDDDSDDHDDDSDDYDDDSDDVGSADPSVGCCSLWVGDPETARDPNGVGIRYGGDDVDDGAEKKTAVRGGDVPADEDDEDDDGCYADATDAAEDVLSEVRLVWTDALYRCTVNGKNVPDSYTRTSSIEKLVLLYAKNFIEQFKVKYPNRKQLVLVHENECGVQKCICTTIKPSRLVYHDLNGLISYSEFVAKHITYINLNDPILVPRTIVSPATTLEVQTANCFELATLLVSFLIGCGYNAFVVHGYATESVCNNDRTRIKLDLPKDGLRPSRDDEPENYGDVVDDYDAEPTPDLCSEYVTLLMEEENKNKAIVPTEVKIGSDRPSERLYGQRVHSWVLIMPSDANDESITAAGPYFIEPSTSESTDVSNDNYIGIEAIWNDKNYWVNLQELDGGCTQYDFTLTNTECWEHFLPDERQSLRGLTLHSSHNDNVSFRPLVMPNSWVNVLEVPRNKYLMLYPSGKKVVLYMNALQEYYSDYIIPDGLIEKTTFYAEPDYASKTFVKEIYKHRVDKLISVEIDYSDKEVETVEYFTIGRKDCLKSNKFCGDGNSIETKRSVTFYNLRLDSVVELQIDPNGFVVTFKDRSDLLFWRMCIFNRRKKNDSHVFNTKRRPINITDKYLRDESKHKDRDIATSQFDLLANSIHVKYQYGEGQITQSSRLFKKPVTSSEGFSSDSITENIVYPYEGHLKPHEAYIMLQEMMQAENEALRAISILEDDIIGMLEIRSREQSEFKLKIDELDWDRNYKIRKLLQIEKDKKLAIAKRNKAKRIDYVLKYVETASRCGDESSSTSLLNVRDKIIKDFRQRTKYKFMRSKNSFTKNTTQLQLMINALEMDNFIEPEHKHKTIILCSLLKNELEVLLMKMKRYRETRVKRYNNLASYLNYNPVFKTLPPLKLI